MESQPQNPEFRINPESFHPWLPQMFVSYLGLYEFRLIKEKNIQMHEKRFCIENTHTYDNSFHHDLKKNDF